MKRELWILLVVGVLFCLVLANAVYGETIELDDLVISSMGYDADTTDIAGAVSIVTAEDIASGQAKTLLDVLRCEEGLFVRDYFGNATRSSIDIRGFGETAAMNTLVLVDGRKVNEVDLSGVDWTQIPLDAVEKIEIMRGGASVLYGDNAVGGVINIITKKPSEVSSSVVKSMVGSYETYKNSFYTSGKAGDLGYVFGGSTLNTRGYRRNSDFQGFDLNAKLTYDLNDENEVYLTTVYHEADFGLAGAIRTPQFASTSRSGTLFEKDEVGEESMYVDLGMTNTLLDDIKLDTAISFRRKKIDNNLNDNSSVDKRRLDTYGFRSKFIIDTDVVGLENKFIAGIDVCRNETIVGKYSGWTPGFVYVADGRKQVSTHIDKDTVGVYFQDTISLTENLDAVVGYRTENAYYTFDVTSLPGPWSTTTAVDEQNRERLSSWNIAFNHKLLEDSKVFISASQSFRLPATDEYYSVWASPPVNTNLKPQKARTYELGGEFNFDNLSVSPSIYEMHLENELYYDPSSWSNLNYNKTVHRGFDLGLKYDLTESVRLRMNYSYTNAYFTGGTYNRNQIPLVPRSKIMIGGTWEMIENLTFGAVANYVGTRQYISDQSHTYPKMKDYVTLDIKLSYKKNNWKIFAGINNLFNEKYGEYGAISIMSSTEGHYPAPLRNYYTGVEVEF